MSMKVAENNNVHPFDFKFICRLYGRIFLEALDVDDGNSILTHRKV